MIYRVFVEKREGFDIKAKNLVREIKDTLGIDCNLRLLNRYDFLGDKEDFDRAINVVFSEPPADNYYLDSFEYKGRILCTRYLTGQYDQRADSAAQCVSMLTQKAQPIIRCATVYVIDGVTDADFERIKQHLINPIESCECGLFDDLVNVEDDEKKEIAKEPRADGFIELSEDKLYEFFKSNGFAFTFADLQLIQQHFAKEKRDPFFAELKILDIYWSDHCRHTTFNTLLENIEIKSEIPQISEAFDTYKSLFDKHYKNRNDKYYSLMDMATIAVRELKLRGTLTNLYDCGEVNACSVMVKADVDGKEEDWVVMFKNETHNHPTEIEPYGGAATCLGGAIRDPLSGGTYVYQAMRVSGAADISLNAKPLKGKLPQRAICKGAAAGFSSYGNQIGLATGLVQEFYHKGYAAKRLEAGFVVGAAPLENLKRTTPVMGDIVLIVGSKTGRDGCGGATGSSKAHDTKSAAVAGAEVQKGNPPAERKLQRLFRNAEFSKMIKRCNDFGAGGIAVAIGELTDSLDINLDLVHKKYEGLTGTELAISESQERMAVVISNADLERAKQLCDSENVDCAAVATVTDTGRLRMFLGGQMFVDLSRKFLDTNGVRQSASAIISDKPAGEYFKTLSPENKTLFDKGEFTELLKNQLAGLDSALQKGLSEMFDSTIGPGTVLMPFGGKNQISPATVMAAKLPTEGITNTATVAAYGFDPYLSEISPFTSAIYAVTNSVAKAAAAGADFDKIYLTFQEYFEKLQNDPQRWGKPASALLGALTAQLLLEKGAIGGKDSMSGSFEDLHVPPTLISFALGLAGAKTIVSSTAKTENASVYRYKLKRDKNGIPDLASLKDFLIKYQKQLANNNIEFATVAESGGAATALLKTIMGGDLGFNFDCSACDSLGDNNNICLKCDTNAQKIDVSLFAPAHGDIIFGIASNKSTEGLEKYCEFLGRTTGDGIVRIGGKEAHLTALEKPFISTLSGLYPLTVSTGGEVAAVDYKSGSVITRTAHIAKPRVFIPVFPGTNCEYDTVKRFAQAGAETDVFIVKNRSAEDIRQSVEEIKLRLNKANILMIPGGFSGSDEPDGSGKFICALFSNPYITEAVNNLLYRRDGLALGICNGFQAFIKLGLLPYGRIEPLKPDSPTLTFNTTPRHVSQIVGVRIASNLSPWLAAVKPGQVYNQPVSHGEGRFIANDKHIATLKKSGQIASQYCDLSGKPTMYAPFNPNGSVCAVEGITSPDGRVLGKMGHSERIGNNLYKNIIGEFDLKLFESGVRYFD